MYESKKWLERLERIIKKYLGEATLSNQKLAEEIKISERHLFRRVKEVTGLSPQKYIRKLRLKMAYKYLKAGEYRTVKEVSKAVGYINTSYFITQFEKEFGKKPFAVLREAGWR